MTALRSVTSVCLYVAGLMIAAGSIARSASPSSKQIGICVSRDPVALGLVNQALALLNGGTSLTDVTLQTTVTYYPGPSQQTGTATLQAIGDGESLLVMNLSGGEQQEIRNAQQGAWVYPDGSFFLEALQNCWADATWFFPGLVLTNLSSNTQMALVNLGSGTWNGSSANVIQTYQSPSPQNNSGDTSMIQGLSTETLYLDPLSSLPLAIDFNLHPDNDANTNLSAEIQLSNYQTVNGMSVPFQVQKLINGSVFLDVVVTSVTVNSGLSQSLFIIP